MSLLVRQAKKRLAVVWFSASGLLFLLVFLQTILGRYGDKAAEAWSWLLPTIVPTLSVIIGVLVMETRAKRARKKPAHTFVYRMAMTLSVAYLLLVGLTLLAIPVAEAQAALTPLKLMKMSHLWLAPCQGLVTAALGAFFVAQ